jgi:hypothetical protein
VGRIGAEKEEGGDEEEEVYLSTAPGTVQAQPRLVTAGNLKTEAAAARGGAAGDVEAVCLPVYLSDLAQHTHTRTHTHTVWASLAARASQPGPMGGAGRPNVGLHSRGREEWRARGGQCPGGSMDPVVAGR